ncbi:peptidase U32 family protein [Saccharicrinis sp. FJH62]|uniref:peptidase U32 family protein n=1 Tax=Saccharicrinis sp. FJH62 TaxID=3344657 RepID=UPI0035D42A4E
MKREDIEIMAPVGSFESLMAAIQGGADSVYFGIGSLNMRSRSSLNFTVDDLHKIVSIAKKHNIKTYLTLNTVMYDNDLNQMRGYVNAAKDAGVSAIIASDVAVMQYANSAGVEVHLSTQLNITNYESLQFYAHFADVAVLARELNLDQVAQMYIQITQNNLCGPGGKPIRLEMFVHGALCMAVSGKCYLSLHEMNASANRGNCMQVCRKGYNVTDKETGIELDIDNEYIMSPKDLKTIHFLNKILDSGVRVLKIEGRARSAEYVKTTVSCYREAVEAWIDDSFTEEKIADWDKRLKMVFNRGFWDGYYLGQQLGEWSANYGSEATKRRIYIGKGTNYFSKLGVAEFQMDAMDLSVGDEILITGPTTGVIEMTVDELRVDLEPVQITRKGERFSISVPEKIRRSDKLYKMVDAKTLPR